MRRYITASVFFTLAIAQNTPFQISAFRKVPSRILP